MDLPPAFEEPAKRLDTANVEQAIKVRPDNLSFRLDQQERDDILLHEQLRELTKSAVVIGIIGLIAVVI